MSSLEAGSACARGIARVYPQAEIVIKPAADGGEGTVDALVDSMEGEYINVKVTGPLGEEVISTYGIIGGETAVMEMSAAAGLPLVPEDRRDPLETTTFGVGEMIKDAVLRGCRRFIIGIGGSATNDGGMGMLQALGFEFFDEEGKTVGSKGKDLGRVQSVNGANAMPQLRECSFKIACDVTNVLCGDEGCSAVYGPQKGADGETVRLMDGWLKNYADAAVKVFPSGDPMYPGSGAAGGLGFAFMTFLGGKLESGIDIVAQEAGLEDAFAGADYVITGEGRMDGQTAMGKVPQGIAQLAKEQGAKTLAFAGGVTDDAGLCNDRIDAFFPIVRGAVSLKDAMDKECAMKNMSLAAEQVFRLIRTFDK